MNYNMIQQTIPNSEARVSFIAILENLCYFNRNYLYKQKSSHTLWPQFYLDYGGYELGLIYYGKILYMTYIIVYTSN